MKVEVIKLSELHQTSNQYKVSQLEVYSYFEYRLVRDKMPFEILISIFEAMCNRI